MASQVFLMSLLLTVISHTVLTTSQPITNHAVKRHSGWWDSEESRKVWPFSHEDHDDHHHARHSGYDDFEHHYHQHHHHEHDENCGHRLTVFKPPSHRHNSYSGQRITPLVYPPLAPINDPSVITTTTTPSSEENYTTTTPSTTRTRVKPPLEPAPIFEDTDDVPDGDIQVPAAFSTTLPINPNTEINTEAEKEAETTTTITTQPFSEIDLRFGA